MQKAGVDTFCMHQVMAVYFVHHLDSLRKVGYADQ